MTVVASFEQRLAQRRDVGAGWVSGELVLLSAADRRLHRLNETAASVWDAVSSSATIDEIVNSVATRYAIPDDVIRLDVLDVVHRLVDGGLLTAATSEHTPANDSLQNVIPRHDEAFHRLPPIHALDARVVLDVDRSGYEADALVDALETALAPLLRLRPADPRTDRRSNWHHMVVRSTTDGWAIEVSGNVVFSANSPALALRSVLAELNGIAVETVRCAVSFHAAAVEIAGKIVVFPGVSNAGKSTLVTQLVAEGAGYVTDEAAAVDVDDLSVRPFHKSICLERGSQTLLADLAPCDPLSGVWDVDPRSVGPGRLSAGGVLDAVVFPKYRPGAEAELTRLEPLSALEPLLANAFDFSRVGAAAFDALARIASDVPCYRLDHGGDGHLSLISRRFGGGGPAVR